MAYEGGHLNLSQLVVDTGAGIGTLPVAVGGTGGGIGDPLPEPDMAGLDSTQGNEIGLCGPIVGTGLLGGIRGQQTTTVSPLGGSYSAGEAAVDQFMAGFDSGPADDLPPPTTTQTTATAPPTQPQQPPGGTWSGMPAADASETADYVMVPGPAAVVEAGAVSMAEQEWAAMGAMGNFADASRNHQDASPLEDLAALGVSSVLAFSCFIDPDRPGVLKFQAGQRPARSRGV